MTLTQNEPKAYCGQRNDLEQKCDTYDAVNELLLEMQGGLSQSLWDRTARLGLN